MIETHHYPKCFLNIGKHKTLDTAVHLEIRTRSDDKYADPRIIEKDEDFIDGVRVTGELSFEAGPLGWDHFVKKNALGTLTINDGGESSKFNILVVEKNSEHVVLKDKIKKYFWLFFVIGKPVYDSLEIFPAKKRSNALNVYTCVDFRGIWPVGVSSVVVARDQRDAKRLLVDALTAAGVVQPEVNELTLQEVDLTRPKALVLNTGEY